MSTNITNNPGEFKHSLHERGGDEDQIFRRLDMGIFQLRLINGCIITYNKRLKKKKKKK